MGYPTKSALTKEERKRNSDRVAQRALRERKKDRIHFLERTLERQQSQDTDGSVRELTKEVERLREEKESLRRLVDQLGGVTSSLQQWCSSAGVGRGSSSESGIAISATSETEVSPPRSPLFIDISRDYERLKSRQDVANILRDSHTILKATLNGWQSIIRTEPNPLNDILECVYERLDLGPKSRFIDQLSIYYLTQMALLILEDPNSESSINMVPFWLHHTETQKAAPHYLVIDMLPWPLMRDYVIHNPSVRFLERDCEAFTLEFLRCIRFVPQISFESSFTINDFSGRLAVSRTYRPLFFDSPPFSMTPEFFTKFPEFIGMIPEWRTLESKAREEETSVVVRRGVGMQNRYAFDKDGEWTAYKSMVDQGATISAALGYDPLEMTRNMPNFHPQDDLLGQEYLEWL
ncbi:hypothetical protein HYFRA_00008656 [Hymenoscyphus fraxineus]|uniref:BZIP domain-containing protein n=1 Tax=Hymenoscyphus fraxineus TaxID=746836 RepID=A0A9N9PUX1_9HELO|nr:hypothetical protein HYFRA_00008656 [Hymenoscyphus fraxineus]